ncbi:hypothetical protein A8C32_13890 [Flavivirga aquatica]|uniref:Uncharacterized protein n=2 Tax=Flavivirga aquatica TaxID=1849968 RepID=A0A1E5TC83_9FLAO|nr:hypothetical protein A8C32_13890 [Flavivirga aquatica]
MKLLKLLLLISVVFIYESCSKDSSIEKEDFVTSNNNKEIENWIIIGDSFKFNYVDPFQEGEEINLTETNTNFGAFLSEVDELNADLKLEDDLFKGVNFKAQNIEGSIVVSNLEKVRSNDSSFFDPRNVGCLPEMENVKICRSESCVKTTLAKLVGSMSSGDSFSVHRKKLGVTIYANSQLKKEAYPFSSGLTDESLDGI